MTSVLNASCTSAGPCSADGLTARALDSRGGAKVPAADAMTRTVTSSTGFSDEGA